MKSASIVLAYGLIVLIGGLIGHAKAGSTASLVSGLVFGTLLIFSAIGIYMRKPFSQYAALVLAFILDGFFTYRFSHSLKFFPAGFMSLLSLMVIIVVALKIRQQVKSRS